MFEGWLLGLLSRALGEYVKPESFALEHVQASMYSGHVVLDSLELKESCFDFLGLPIRLVKGFIGHLEFRVSGGNWTNLFGKSVEVYVRNVHLLVGPKFEWDRSEIEQRNLKIKRALLKRAELFALRRDGSLSSPSSEEEKSKGTGFFERLATQLLDNVEFHVRNVHLRYEDHYSNPQRPFAFGFTMEGLRMKSTDKDFRNTYVDRDADRSARQAIFKRISLQNFSVYCNPVSEDNLLSGLDVRTCRQSEWCKAFAKHVASTSRPTHSAVGGGGRIWAKKGLGQRCTTYFLLLKLLSS